MAEGGTPCLGIGGKCYEIGRKRRANVLTHHQGNAQVDGQATLRTQHHGNGHERGGTL